MVIMQSKKEYPIYTIDLEFRGACGLIAAYLILHDQGAILIETGPGSTIPVLMAGLRSHGVVAGDITDVLVTHIHLDHAGASGWLARQGALIHVHSKGAPHLAKPEKLLASAAQIYGDEMQPLWGEFLPVPENRIVVQEDEDIIEIGGLKIRSLETLGHASHHLAYIFQEVCFTGDIGGVRMAGTRYLRLPMPPPDLHLELWRKSARRLQAEYSRDSFRRIALTHFGIFDDPVWHLSALEQTLDEVEEWASSVMPSDPPIEEIRSRFMDWERERVKKASVERNRAEAIDIVNASWMSAYGIQRYWHKVRNAPADE
jgi:glyoxylase-like metal-dependent hydrolase (beta-lactamase superfamily II)